MAQHDSKYLLSSHRKQLPQHPRTSSAPPASHPRSKKETLLLPKILSSSASSAERSMLRSMLRTAKEAEITPIHSGLRKHEYKDDSEDEERSERRARSASYGSNVFRNRQRRETPPLRFVREKTGDVATKQKEPPARKLVFDSEFGFYYDPLTDRYYTVENPP